MHPRQFQLIYIEYVRIYTGASRSKAMPREKIFYYWVTKNTPDIGRIFLLAPPSSS